MPHLGAPLIFSLPHLYGVDTKYTTTLEGLHPEKMKHEGFIILEPVSTVRFLKHRPVSSGMLDWLG